MQLELVHFGVVSALNALCVIASYCCWCGSKNAAFRGASLKRKAEVSAQNHEGEMMTASH